MRYPAFALSLAALAFAPQVALADEPAPAPEAQVTQEASIPFANQGGVWNWRAEGNEAVYFQDGHRQWYKATLFTRAHDLPFVEYIGIDASPNGALDKWSAIYVNGQRYSFSAFEKVDGPPVKRKKKAKAED